MGPNASRSDMRIAMAETPKLSVEKALEKLRAADATKSKAARRAEEMDALDDEIKRLRAQRLRLDRTSEIRPRAIETATGCPQLRAQRRSFECRAIPADAGPCASAAASNGTALRRKSWPLNAKFWSEP